MDDDSSIRQSLVRQITQDEMAAEFRLAMFSAALLSYRRGSCVLPFPPSFVDKDGNKDLSRLEDVFHQLVSLQDFIGDPLLLTSEALSLLCWIVSDKSFSVKYAKDCQLKELESMTGRASFTVQPDYIFELDYQNTRSKKFAEYAEKYDVKLGYHGSRMDNFHSILHNGLQVHMTKNALFGEGIYLSEDFSVTLPYSKPGNVWRHSKLGHQLSCIVVCKIIDHPLVKCKIDNIKSKRSRAKDTQAGDVPEKYFVVTSSEMVQPRYMLVFGQKKSKERKQNHKWIFMKYPVASILCLYAVFLFFMGLWKSNRFQMFLRRYWVDRFVTESDH